MSPMLVCKTELESPAWRTGMIEALTMGHSLADCGELRGGRLYLALLRRFTQLAPPAYRTYRRSYMQLGDAHRIFPERLSFWQWRTCGAGVVETAGLDSLLGCATGSQAARVRCTLLLTTEDWDEGLSQAPYACGCTCDLAPNEIDGQIDGYQLCARLMYDENLDGDRYLDAVAAYLEALWPADYRYYRSRYAACAREACYSHPDSRLKDVGPRLEYRLWSVFVRELHAEIRRCRRAGVESSRNLCELSRRLLWHPGEPLPVVDWTPPELLAGSCC
jgi:hypothetical protein